MSPDVVVVGAGPVGCVTALAHARAGARVLLLDPAADQRDRFAGELLHPAGVAALAEVGVERVPPAEDHGPARGFAVIAASGTHVLDYPGRRGLTFPFPALQSFLRQTAASHPLVTFAPRCKALSVEGQTLTYEDRSAATPAVRTVSAPLLVGADGRFSTMRRAVVAEDEERKVPLSAMAGLLLRDVSLPHEGYGHVVLGRVGPALIYRIAPDLVRVCLDVPTPWRRHSARNALIRAAYERVLPPSVAGAVHEALEADRVAWAVNAVAPRTVLGRPGLALVGDAVGHFHPMTAAGLSLGFADALELARAPSFEAYREARTRDAACPGLLATALYEIFSLDTEPTRACREAIFHLWRDEALRRRTMAFLSLEDTSVRRLLAVGVRFVLRASASVAARGAREGRVRDAADAVRRIAGLVHWLANDSVPAPMRLPFVQKAATPFEPLRHLQVARFDREAAELVRAS